MILNFEVDIRHFVRESLTEEEEGIINLALGNSSAKIGQILFFSANLGHVYCWDEPKLKYVLIVHLFIELRINTYNDWSRNGI